MRSKWLPRRIGDFCAEVQRRPGGADLPVLSLTKDRGLVLQTEKFKKRIASTDVSRYKKVELGEFVYDPMLLWSGSVARQMRVEEGVVSPAYYVFSADSTVDSNYLEFVLRHPKMFHIYGSISQGTNIRRKKAAISDFFDLELLLPSLSEQVRIASMLSAMDEAMAKSKAVAGNARNVLWAMMEILFTMGDPRSKRSLRKSYIGEVPFEWKVVELNDCIEPDRPICYGILKPGKDFIGGIPVVKVRNIRDGRIDMKGLLHTSPDIDAQYRRSRLRANDLLLTIRGTTGRVAIVPPSLEGANITQDTARISLKEGISVSYLYYCLQAPLLQKQIKDHTRGQAVKGINIQDVRKLLLPLPSFEEQRYIAEVLSSCAAYLDHANATISALQVVRSSLASALLSGEIRIAPDEAPS
jgi:type I restriction enzyme S subunit